MISWFSVKFWSFQTFHWSCEIDNKLYVLFINNNKAKEEQEHSKLELFENVYHEHNYTFNQFDRQYFYFKEV